MTSRIQRLILFVAVVLALVAVLRIADNALSELEFRILLFTLGALLTVVYAYTEQRRK